ncbi:MAG TPA: hypothetical protein PKE56_16270, partial [Acidimicrobiales bacterium]|nr:hypothetical protein [Acidimicrobiales bacterium]
EPAYVVETARVLADVKALLKTFDDAITVASLTPPTGVEFMVEGDLTIATVARPLTEEELKKLEESQVGDVTAVKSEADEKKAGGALAALTTVEFPDERQLALLQAGETVVTAEEDALELVAPDRPGLFVRVAGVLALHGLDVLSADATARDGMALERFRVTSRFGSMIAWDRVEADLLAALDHRLALEARLAERIATYSRGGPRPGLPPASIRFDDAASRTATVIELTAPDRIGLLYRVLRSFAELDLDVRVAKVQTLGDLMIDAFYVTRRDGSLVADPDVRAELERSLLHAVS